MPPAKSSLRVASLNLLNSPLKLVERYGLLQMELRRLNPDVLCLQEVLVGEHDRLRQVLAEVGFVEGYFGGTIHSDRVLGGGPADSGNAVFVKTRQVKFSELGFREDLAGLKVPAPAIIPSVVAAISDPFYRGSVYVVSSHFAWGQLNEAVRLRQASAVNDLAETVKMLDGNAVVVHGGDLNAPEQSSALRFLYGLQADYRDRSTHWVDAWKLVGTVDNEWTSNPVSNGWAKATATKLAGMPHPDLIPPRRIDYMMSHGWVYGRRGGPVSFVRWAQSPVRGLEISDHAGVAADFAL